MLELVYSNNATFLREKNIAGTTVVHFPNKLFRHKKNPFAKKIYGFVYTLLLSGEERTKHVDE